MKNHLTVRAIVPKAPTHIKCRDGNTYQIGGFPDADIEKIAQEMLRQMLETAREQRRAKEAQEKTK